MRSISFSLSFRAPGKVVFFLIFLFIQVGAIWSQKANEDERIELDEAFLNSLKTHSDSVFNYKIDSLFGEIDYQEDLPIEELYRELDLGTMYDSINMDRVFQNLDWNDAIGDVDWKELMKEVDWQEIRKGQSPGGDNGNGDMFNSSYNKQFINLEGFDLPISAISKCMTFSPALMEAIDIPCLMKMMEEGGMESLLEFSPEKLDAISQCVDFSKMMDNMDWDCVMNSVDMNELMKNYRINDFFKSVDTLNSNNRDEWIQEYLDKTPVLKHMNLDSFTNKLKISDELISNPNDVHRMNKNFHSKVFSQLWSKMEGGNFSDKMMNLSASMMVKYFGVTTSSKRYMSFYKLIYKTAFDMQKSDYRSALNSSILQKDLLIQAYFDNSFDSLFYFNENVRESIGVNFEVNNLASVYQNIGFNYMSLGNFEEALKSLKVAEQLELIFLKSLQSDLSISNVLVKNYSKSKLEKLKIQYSINTKWVDLQKFTLLKGRILEVVDEKITNGQLGEALTICKITNDIILEQDSLGQIIPMFGVENKLMDNEFKSQMLRGLYKNMERILDSDKNSSSSERYKYKMAAITLEKFKHEQRLVFIYNTIGNVYMLRKQYSLSLEYQKEALNLLKSLKNLDYVHWTGSGVGDFEKDYNNKLPIHINIISNVAELYIMRKEYSNAIDFIVNDAIPYMEIVNKREINSSADKKEHLNLETNMFPIYASLAKSYMHLGNAKEAFRAYQKCGSISRKSDDIAYIYLYDVLLGQYYLKFGEPSKAITQLNSSVSHAKSWKDYNALGVAYLSLAMANYASKDFDKAQIYCDSSRYVANKNDYEEINIKAEVVNGYIYLAQDKINNAEISFDKGIAFLEKKIFKNSQSHFSKQLSLESSFDAYSGAIICALKQGNEEKAFNYIQKVKSRTLNDLLKEGAYKSADIPTELKDDRNNLIAQLNISQKNRILGFAKKTDSGRQDSLLKELEIVEAKIKQTNKTYSDLVSPTFSTYSNISSRLKDNQAFVEYFVGGSIYAFVFTKNKHSIFTIENKSDIFSLLESFVSEVDSVSNADNKSKLAMNSIGNNLKAYSSKLHESIFEPINESGILDGIDELIIAPDNMLYRLPFELLIEKKSVNRNVNYVQFLGDSYTINYYQSASIYNNTPRFKKSNSDEDKLLALSKSNFKEYPKLIDLKTLNEEKLKESFNRLAIIKDDEATLEEISRKDLSIYMYLYFSTHAVIDEIPELSYLALTNSQLSLFNTFDLKLNSKVIVLSACQTAKGAFQRGGGIMGFTRGLMYAGTESVVISLWPVEDVASEHLFNRFWANIDSGDRPKVALQEAKQYLRTVKKKYDNPFYWAGFVLFGQG